MNLALELSEIEKQVSVLISENIEYKKQLTKAEEIIKNSIILLTKTRTAPDTKTYLMKAEQFLRETDIDNAIQKANEGLVLDKIADEVEQDIKEQKVK